MLRSGSVSRGRDISSHGRDISSRGRDISSLGRVRRSSNHGPPSPREGREWCERGGANGPAANENVAIEIIPASSSSRHRVHPEVATEFDPVAPIATEFDPKLPSLDAETSVPPKGREFARADPLSAQSPNWHAATHEGPGVWTPRRSSNHGSPSPGRVASDASGEGQTGPQQMKTLPPRSSRHQVHPDCHRVHPEGALPGC